MTEGPRANPIVKAEVETGLPSQPSRHRKFHIPLGKEATRLDVLERVNELNIAAFIQGNDRRYWTCTVLYNTVIWRSEGNESFIHEVIEGVPK